MTKTQKTGGHLSVPTPPPHPTHPSACWVFSIGCLFCHFLVLAASFRGSVILQTLTWTTGSLTCVRHHSYAYVYTWGLGTLTARQHIFDSEKLTSFSCAPNGLQILGHQILSPTLYQVSHSDAVGSPAGKWLKFPKLMWPTLTKGGQSHRENHEITGENIT